MKKLIQKNVFLKITLCLFLCTLHSSALCLTENEFEEIKIVAEELRKQDGIPVFVGRSLTPVSLYLELVQAKKPHTLPLSRFAYKGPDPRRYHFLEDLPLLQPRLDAVDRENLYKHFDLNLPTDAELGARAMVIVDYAAYGKSLYSLAAYIDDYRKSRSRKFKLEVCAVTRPSVRLSSNWKFFDSQTKSLKDFRIIDLESLRTISKNLSLSDYEDSSNVALWKADTHYPSRFGVPLHLNRLEERRGIKPRDHLVLRSEMAEFLGAKSLYLFDSSQPNFRENLRKVTKGSDVSSLIFKKIVNEFETELQLRYQLYGSFYYALIDTMVQMNYLHEAELEENRDESKVLRSIGEAYSAVLLAKVPSDSEGLILFNALPKSLGLQHFDSMKASLFARVKTALGSCSLLYNISH